MTRIRGTTLPSCEPDAGGYPCRDTPTDVAAFEIDTTEVSTERYAECVNAGACTTKGLVSHPWCNWGRKAQRAHHPINCVSFDQSEAYCRWAGKRLPSGDEWLAAARGPGRLRYPWGNEEPTYDLSLLRWGCWHTAGTCEIGTHRRNDQHYPLSDTEGNVAEWTTDEPCTRPYEYCWISPSERGRRWRMAFGRSFVDPELDITSMMSFIAFHHYQAEQTGKPSLGFRCAR